MNVYLVGAKNPEIRRQILAQEAFDRNWRMAGFIDNNPALEEDRQLLVGRALELETQLESEGQT